MASWNQNEENSDEDDIEEYYNWNGREAIIFLVDAFLSSNQSFFDECLLTIKESLLNGLLCREKDLIGIVFCNTKHSPEPKDNDGYEQILVHKNTAIFLPLKELSQNIVSYYLEFASPDYFDFQNRYGCEEGSFSDALWLCTNMFKQTGYKLQSPTIVFFTNKQSPHACGSQEYQLAMNKSFDLQDLKIEFTVIPICDFNFNYELFYHEFICCVRDFDIDEFIVPDTEEEKQLITVRQLRLNFKRRCNNHIKWTISQDVQISIGLYKSHRKNIYPKSIKLLRHDNSIVDTKHVFKIRTFDKETQEMLHERYCLPGDQRKVIVSGGTKVAFTGEEYTKLKSPMPPELRLLGFESKVAIDFDDFIRSCDFIYPDEEVISGSTTLFRALWKRCLDRDTVAICVLVARRKTPPRYVVLVPTTCSESAVHSTAQNDGFRMFYLPCKIDYRSPDYLDDIFPPEVPDEGKVLFEKICKKLKTKYHFSMFKDPSLKELNSNILRSAFDIADDVSGGAMEPDLNLQDSRIEPLADLLAEMFGQDLTIAPKRTASAKADGESGPSSKVPRITDDNLTREQIDSLIANNALESLTVKQLKTYLQANNVKGISSATKPTLITKIMELHS